MMAKELNLESRLLMQSVNLKYVDLLFNCLDLSLKVI